MFVFVYLLIITQNHERNMRGETKTDENPGTKILRNSHQSTWGVLSHTVTVTLLVLLLTKDDRYF